MQAPTFSLKDQNGDVHTLEEYAGKWLVLYFYIKDETPGCTNEACNFRDAEDQFAELSNVAVVGISPDSTESHKAFAERHGLNFTLLSDPDHQALKAFGAWGMLGPKRRTLIINPKGEIVKEYSRVEPKTHATEIIADLKNLRKSGK